MNKQEFQQKIKDMKPPKFFNAITLVESYKAGFEEAKGNALCDSCFLNEPEKPVVPQFVANWYEDNKDNFEYSVQCLCVHGCLPVRKIQTWFDNEDNKPIETLVMMHKFGYVIEEGEKMNKPTVPQFVADWYEEHKDNFEIYLSGLCINFTCHRERLNDKLANWYEQLENKPIQTLVNMHQFGYEIEKEKLYRAKNRHTGEYLCYCFEFYHDKNSSSENQRFTAEEKRWKELGYWGNDLYIFEEAGGEDE